MNAISARNSSIQFFIVLFVYNEGKKIIVQNYNNYTSLHTIRIIKINPVSSKFNFVTKVQASKL